MQQFTVPQFIDVEDKIIGPITTRQFIIMLSCFALMGIFYKIFDFSAFIAASVLAFFIFGTFAFAKVNGRPFHLFMLNLMQTSKKPNTRVWNHAINKTEAEYKLEEEKKIKETPLPPAKHYTTSRLAELALIADTRGTYKGGEKDMEIEIETIKK